MHKAFRVIYVPINVIQTDAMYTGITETGQACKYRPKDYPGGTEGHQHLATAGLHGASSDQQDLYIHTYTESCTTTASVIDRYVHCSHEISNWNHLYEHNWKIKQFLMALIIVFPIKLIYYEIKYWLHYILVYFLHIIIVNIYFY